ncbi:MFS transporter [Burkholderia plantarii]|uniref:MFS transporter n=1 Tax=Burkholderia plantarii TaxID=41899 RepID=UPI0006D8AC0B|nr:MFS transporter [Burkholderia plantarii]
MLGVFGIFHLTDRPEQAKWLSRDEKAWLANELEISRTKKSPTKKLNTLEALRQPVLWELIQGYVGIFCGNETVGGCLAQILHVYGVPLILINLVAEVSPLAGMMGMAILLRRSDRRKERIWHTVGCTLIAALGYGTVAASGSLSTALIGFVLANIGVYASLAIFWSIRRPTFHSRFDPP